MKEPLTTRDCDLRKFDGFMLNVDRLLSSELWALSTGDEFKAALSLWCRAWKQVPCGSLPDDDGVLQAFSGAGVKWPKVRTMALRGFVKCLDGRLYHVTLCEDARRAAQKLSERRTQTEVARAARQKQKRGVTDSVTNSVTDSVTDSVTNIVTDSVTDSVTNIVTMSQRHRHRHRVKEQEQEYINSSVGNNSPRARDVDSDRHAAKKKSDFERICDALGGFEKIRKWTNLRTVSSVWLAEADIEKDILPAIAGVLDRRKGHLPDGPNYFTAAIKQQRQARMEFGENAPKVVQRVEVGEWKDRMRAWHESHSWSVKSWGPKPGDDGCLVPPEIIEDARKFFERAGTA